MIALNREKATFGLLCLLPFLAFMSLGFYSHYTISRLLLLIECGVFFLILLLNTKAVGKWHRWGILFINLISVAITLSSHTGIGVAISFFNLLISVMIFNNIALTNERKGFLHFLTAVLLLFFYVISNFGRLHERITMMDFRGFSLNSNVVGMLLLALFLHAFNYVNGLRLEKRKKVFWLSLVIGVCGYVICLTWCRSAIISFAVFLGLLSLGRLCKRPIPHYCYKLTVSLVLFLSLAFTLLYVYLSYNMSDLTILNKRLFTGREIVWQSAYGLISETPIFGHGTDVLLNTVGGEKTTSAHNMLLSFLYTLGIIPTSTIALMFVNKSRGLYECKRDKTTQLALIASLFVCFFESFYADPSLQIFFSLLLLSNVKINVKEETK